MNTKPDCSVSEAQYYVRCGDTVRCTLCPVQCRLAPGRTGFCRARTHRGGVLAADTYGFVSALALDPIEKKPLYHFHPNKQILSLGGWGCNMRCPYCQNHSIAMRGMPSDQAVRKLTPAQAARQAADAAALGNIGLAYTYNEPVIAYEYVRDCARAVREAGMLNVLVTNGFISEEPWSALLDWTDAVNIDWKTGSASAYRELGADIAQVRRNLAAAVSRCHVEVTVLVVPGFNDSEAEMHQTAAFLASLDPDIPLHLSRFFPRHRMADRLPTPVETLLRLQKTAQNHLRYVYTGNMP